MFLRASFTVLIALITGFSGNSQSMNMTLEGSYNPASISRYNDCWGYTAGGREYALIGTISSVSIVDVTDCANPISLQNHVLGDNVTWRDIKTYGNYAYSMCDGNSCNEGLTIFNLSGLPGSSSFTQTTAFFTKAHNLYIDEANGRLYVVGANTQRRGVIILDIATDPANPSVLLSVNLSDFLGTSDSYYIHDLYVKDNIAYCSHGETQAYGIWDFNDLSNIKLLSAITTGAYNHSSWITDDGNYAYYAEEVPTGLPMGILDISNAVQDFGTITDMGRFSDKLETTASNLPTPHNPYVLGNELYISYYQDGVQVFDITDPLNPTKKAYYDTTTQPNGGNYTGTNGNWGVYPYLPSGCIVATDVNNGAFFLNVQTAVPVEWSSFDVTKTNKGKVSIEWKTAAEIGNSHFEILRSLDGGRSFSAIGRVEGSKDANFENSYSFMDVQPKKGDNYYKIRQVDLDGEHSETSVKSVRIQGLFNSSLTASPNPSDRFITLNNDETSLDLTYTITDILGRIVQEGIITTQNQAINIQTLEQGQFVISLSDGKQVVEKTNFTKI